MNPHRGPRLPRCVQRRNTPHARARERGWYTGENMDEKTEAFQKLVKKEKQKITRELKKAKISDYKMKIIEPVIANTAWMRVKLDETRELIAQEDIVVDYDNGGGQKGIRKNPFFDGYEALFKAYMLGMGRILDLIPDKNVADGTFGIKDIAPQTALDKVRNKQRESA